jgi:hypothetical protein
MAVAAEYGWALYVEFGAFTATLGVGRLLMAKMTRLLMADV